MPRELALLSEITRPSAKSDGSALKGKWLTDYLLSNPKPILPLLPLLPICLLIRAQGVASREEGSWRSGACVADLLRGDGRSLGSYRHQERYTLPTFRVKIWRTGTLDCGVVSLELCLFLAFKLQHQICITENGGSQWLLETTLESKQCSFLRLMLKYM